MVIRMEENREIMFARTLENVRALARRQGNRISGQQVREGLEALSLSEEQLEMVLDYLRGHKVVIGEAESKETLAEAEVLSEEETDYLEEYKKQLAGGSEVSEGEKEALILSAMAGEADAQQRLICVYLPRVLDIARLYAGQGVLLEDLIGEGNVALSMGVTMLGCLENAKEAEGALIKMVMDAMEESIDENEQELEKDRRIAGKVNEVAKKAGELAKELRRKVTVKELAAETKMPEEEIRDAMRMSGYAIEDLESAE